MICISLSADYVRFSQLVKAGDDYSIETVQKKILTAPFIPANLTNPQLAADLENIFQQIRVDLPLPDRYAALTLPAEWFDLNHQSLETGLDREDISTALDWGATKRLGSVADEKFVQHYLLDKKGSAEQEYLTVSYFKQLGKLLLDASKAAGFEIHIMDVNLFSAAHALERLESIGKKEKWAVWLVDEPKHSLIVIEGGEYRQLLHFEFTDSENYSITATSSPDDIGENIVATINSIRTFASDSLSGIDRLYYYAHNVDSGFFNMLLTYDIENMKTIDPFVKFKPKDLYEADGDGIGAMCQFIDLIGLMYRKIPESAE
jgi:hypothetical protein